METRKEAVSSPHHAMVSSNGGHGLDTQDSEAIHGDAAEGGGRGRSTERRLQVGHMVRPQRQLRGGLLLAARERG